MNSSAPATFPDLLRLRFEAFIEALCRCVAAEGSKHRIAGPLVVLIWTRLRRLATRFARLGTNPASNRPDHRSGKSGRSKNLPRGFGWLLRLMPGTAAIAGQFRHLLDTPEMADFMASTPASGRILRPLCHTLGMRVPAPLRLPPRKRKPRYVEADNPAATESAPRDPPTPSLFASPPDSPAWPRAPGADRFFRRRPKLGV